jgi:hypothetical protein
MLSLRRPSDRTAFSPGRPGATPAPCDEYADLNFMMGHGYTCDMPPQLVPASIRMIEALPEGGGTESRTATGDDGNVGTASSYLVKYSTSTITAGNFDSATAYPQNWAPLASGNAENHTLGGLTGGQTYYVAIKVLDDVLNTSPMSNVASAVASAFAGFARTWGGTLYAKGVSLSFLVSYQSSSSSLCIWNPCHSPRRGSSYSMRTASRIIVLDANRTRHAVMVSRQTLYSGRIPIN